jgi:hypothetical protein
VHDYENAVVRIAIEMARERGARGRSLFRYTPDEIMTLVPVLRANGELWQAAWTAHPEIRNENPGIRMGYVIRSREDV